MSDLLSPNELKSQRTMLLDHIVEVLMDEELAIDEAGQLKRIRDAFAKARLIPKPAKTFYVADVNGDPCIDYDNEADAEAHCVDSGDHVIEVYR